MKKIILIASMSFLLIQLTSCGKVGEKNSFDDVGPTPTETETAPAEDADPTLTIENYYPMIGDMEYVYEGSGNEYASYRTYIDYLDTDRNRIQTRTNNGGTETVRVLERKDGRLSVVYRVDETYYRENFLDEEANVEAEVLLMEPLVEGTEWNLPDGRKRYISGTEVKVQTPSGTYQTLEVTTESEDSLTKDYYALETGLVKSLFRSGDMEVTSSLSRITKDTPFTQVITVYYPDSDGAIYTEQSTLSFYTGVSLKDLLPQAIEIGITKASYMPLFSPNTVINSLNLSYDGIVTIDLSPEFVKEMNAGSGFELMLLQCITNTLGNYYGADEVLITIDGKPYESGHFLLKEGETMKFNMDNVVE